MFKALIRTLALILALEPALAFAQTAPATLPDHTVYGRIGTGSASGPGQAIPFTTLATQIGLPRLPEIYATSYGVKCDGVTPDSTALQLAIDTAASLGAGTVILPVGTCILNKNVFLNKFTTVSALTVPGLKLKGQGRGVTILDTRVANDNAISVNPEWKAAHQALFGIAAATTGGTLATNTYYVQITENDNSGNEIYVTSPKSIAVTGATGSISITLPALHTGYSYNIHLSTTSGTPTNYAVFNGGNASAVAGNQSGTISAIGAARTVPTAKLAVWQEASVSDLSITNSTNAAGASGVSFFKVGYSDLTNVYMKGLSGDGFGLAAYTGDVDGSFNVAIHNSKFDTIAGTCVNAAGNVLETSNFTVDERTVFNICGTLPAALNVSKTISAISNSSSSVVTTSSAHNWALRDQIYISGVAGMTLADGWFRVCGSVGSANFNLCDLNGNQVDTTSLGSYTASSGVGKLAWRPPFLSGGVITGGGGCLAWTGLIGTFRNLDFTQCNNFGIYFTEAGANDNATIENVDLENTAGKGLYAAALVGGSFTNSECLSASSLGATISCAQLGTGFAAGGVQNFLIDRIKVRSDVTPVTAFEQFKNTNNTGAFIDTVRRGRISWQAFDAAGQTRSNGFVDDQIVGMAQFSISATDTAKLAPVGYGGCVPIHLKANGEWKCVQVPTAGATAATGTLSATTTYNFYAYNSAAATAPEVVAIDPPSATAPTIIEGYKVKTGDTSRTFIGSAPTDGSGHFQTTGAFTSWYPAAGSSAAGDFTVAGNLTVVGTTNLGGAIVDPNGLLVTNVAAPSTPAAGTTRVYVDSTQKVLTFLNDAAVKGNAVVPSTCSSSNWFRTLSAAGALGCSQPSFSDLTGSLACAQAPALTGNVTTSAGSCATTIGANQVARSMEAQGVARSVIGVTGNATANVADIQGTANQFLGVNSAGTALAFNTMSQDCTLATGVITCTKTNNVSFTGPATAAYAAKTDMQTPSSSTLVVNARDVQDHPGVAKFAGRLDGKTGATCAVTSGYNIASCSRSGTGSYTVNFTTNFAAATYSLSGSAYNSGVSTGIIAPGGTFAVGSVSFFCINVGTNAVMDCDIMNIEGFGAQ